MSHSHELPQTNVNTAFTVGIVLNLAFVIVEVVAGLFVHSLSLLSDAGHNLADVGALGLSLLAYRLLTVKSTSTYTYGFRKTSILVALVNAVVLLVSIGAIAFEAARRLFHPEPLPGATIALVAGIGIVINATSALMFMRGKDRDINIRGAYLHLLSDALISLGLVVGGVAMLYTGWFWLDPVLCLGIAITILFSTWRLLRDSVRMSLDAVPHDLTLAEIKRTARSVPGVNDFHHVHVWTIGPRENALTAHVVIPIDASIEQELQVKQAIKHELMHLNIHHITLEIERDNEKCEG
jgi:cobalt-zinc-cadmium efflux system protein